MINVLAINDLLQWKDNSSEQLIERILWIDKGGIIAFTIDINKRTSNPVKRKVSEIQEGLEEGSITKLDSDSWIRVFKEDELSKKSKEIRDKTWIIVQEITGVNNEPDIYLKENRRKLILKASEKFGVSERVIYKYLQKYWLRGKNKNALLPDFNMCGAAGKERVAGEKKRGRPRKNQDILGVGINADEETKKIFRVSINRFYNTTKENPLNTAYELMLKEYYSDDFRFEDGVKKPILNFLNGVPTMDQFRYWYEKEKNIKKEITTRKSAKKYELQHRAVLGSSMQEAFGPGSLYQIDATIADVYLVSRYNRNWIIGRPVVYSVMDVFSRMITGIYVGLEGPSWVGAMMALANAATDKISFCKEYGIEITEEQWMVHHLPQAILADRGEFEGKKVEGLINALNVKISNTSPYRADWKGIIEQNFRVTNLKVKPFLPGFINQDFRERGGRDYRLDAKLDLYQLTQIIIKCVLYHNNEHWLKNYDREEMMITDNVDNIPGKLWEWGIRNRAGQLRSYPDDIIKLNLMPIDNASVTYKGIRFKQLYYSCESALKEMWFDSARAKGHWKVKISYDPRNMNYIYLRNDGGKTFEKCFLLERENRFKNKTIEEIDYLIEYEKLLEKQNREKVAQSKIDLFSDIQAIIKNAEKETNMVQLPEESKSLKLNGIRNNRKIEKEKNRENEAFELGKVNIDDVAQIISLDSGKEENNDTKDNDALKITVNNSFHNNKKDYLEEVYHKDENDDEEDVVNEMELLRRIQKEKLNGSNK